jgi:hypothetical protein
MISALCVVLPCFPVRLVCNVCYVMCSELFFLTCLHVVYFLVGFALGLFLQLVSLFHLILKGNLLAT